MKLWSKGLGKTEVEMDFRYYEVVRDRESGNVSIIGNMRDPVNWEFRILLEPSDMAGFMKVFFSLSMIWFAIRNFFHYFIYLFNRKRYAPPEDLEQKVLTAYDGVMRRASRRRNQKQDSKKPTDKEVKANAA